MSCCIKFTDETAFLLHIASHEVTSLTKCTICYRPFKTAADICMHFVKYHKTYLTTGIKDQGDIGDSDRVSDLLHSLHFDNYFKVLGK